MPDIPTHYLPCFTFRAGESAAQNPHVFYPPADKVPADKRLYEIHRAEILANAYSELKLLQQGGSLEHTRLDCDRSMLTAFYNARIVIEGVNPAPKTPYFSHTLFDNLQKAYDGSPDHFKHTSDRDLLHLARTIGAASSYSPEVFSAITESLFAAHAKLRPFTAEKMDDGSGKQVTLLVDENKAPDAPLVEKAIRQNLLPRGQPYVMALQQAEARVLGLQKQMNR